MITLLYFSVANRLMSYVSILVLQGLLVCGVSLLSLNDMNLVNLGIILLETLIVKAILMPYFIRRVILQNNITREAEPSVPNSISLAITSAIIVLTYIATYYVPLNERINLLYFVTALSAILSGLYFIATRRKVITHVICYVIIENGAFILSMAVGGEMPAMVNLGVLLDVLVSVFLLVLFINKVGDVTEDGDVGGLTTLKD